MPAPSESLFPSEGLLPGGTDQYPAVGLLEYSDDPLSDATPSYTDRTAYLVGDVTWSDGRSRDLDEPQAGSISFRLKNTNGEWFPNSPDSLYPDSPFILRRFRWSVNGTPEKVWFVTRWQPVYPAGTSYSEIEVTAVDGFELLSLDNLDLLDPPTASSYEEVVMQDQPFAYYRLNEFTGTAMRPVTGPEGGYLNTAGGRVALALPENALILGDSSTGAQFFEKFGVIGYARARIEDNPFTDQNAVSVECWTRLATAASDSGPLMGGPFVTTLTDLSFRLEMDGTSNVYRFEVVTGTSTVVTATSTTAPNPLVVHHVVGTWDGQTARLYVNGDLEGTTAASGDLRAGNASEFIYVGGHPSVGHIDCGISDAAFYEYALPAERVMAHYQAGAERGFDAQTAGARISAVADSPLWAETEIQTGEHTVHPVMEHGQSKLEEITAAVKAEMPDNHFFFDGDGNPTYLAWNYKDGLGPLATFGPGGIGYQSIEPVYDDEMFTEVTVGHEAAPGEETQHTETDAASESEFRRRAHAETGLILTDHQDAIAVAAAILERFRGPQSRYASLTINGAQAAARTQILARQIGDMIRVKGVGVNDSDIVTTILGRSKTLSAAGHLTCTWTLARGFDAAAGTWRLGISGFTELGETTVLG